MLTLCIPHFSYLHLTNNWSIYRYAYLANTTLALTKVKAIANFFGFFTAAIIFFVVLAFTVI